MAIVPCLLCDQDGCRYCKFTGAVETGEHLRADQRPLDAGEEWEGETTQEMPAFNPGGKEAA